MMKKVFFLKPKRTWHDYNVFERKMWAQLFTEKKSELRRRFGHSIECYRIAKRYADNEMRCLGQVKDISDANKITDVVVEFSTRRREKVG
ncbi:hypothetical protein [Alteribacillus bidgolensis]|uniref:Uncharacterized protein n=1 Tax=Alteribacillus bidgolensis TaxID=930129 RepID=A0A1G8NJU7_9BACI|nr:hypothetical protein [Alteribacillus bidgolensis]SDI80473.1 hypothetical protein SAMN05216352_11253 [Alteribacillus bidgolensis]